MQKYGNLGSLAVLARYLQVRVSTTAQVPLSTLHVISTT